MKALYRIVSALLAIAVLPVAVFTPLLIYRISFTGLVSGIAGLLGGIFKGDAAQTIQDVLNSKIGEELSIWGGYKNYGTIIKDLISKGSTGNFTLGALKGPITAFLVFFAAALLIAVVIFFFSAFSNNKKTIAGLSLGGCGMLIGMKIAFDSVSDALINGGVTLSDIFGSEIVSTVLQVEVLDLRSAFYYMLILFAAIFLWTLCFLLINIGADPDEKKKKSRKTADANP
ncbi:MAG: hypothetical protein GX051_04400 [Clostridiales bacterium]|nr:hypothetical protein [Clostridiales bacterium]